MPNAGATSGAARCTTIRSAPSAWHDPLVSSKQVKLHVGRLRRKLGVADAVDDGAWLGYRYLPPEAGRVAATLKRLDEAFILSAPCVDRDGICIALHSRPPGELFRPSRGIRPGIGSHQNCRSASATTWGGQACAQGLPVSVRYRRSMNVRRDST